MPSWALVLQHRATHLRALPGKIYRGEQQPHDYEDRGTIHCRFVDSVMPELETPVLQDRESSEPRLFVRLSDSIQQGDRIANIRTRSGRMIDDRTYVVDSVTYRQRFSNESTTMGDAQLRRITG